MNELAIAYILQGVLKALDYIHHMGYVHRCVLCPLTPYKSWHLYPRALKLAVERGLKLAKPESKSKLRTLPLPLRWRAEHLAGQC